MAFISSMLFAIGAMLCWGIGDFLIQKTTRKTGNLQALAFIGIIGALIFLPFAIKDFGLFLALPNILFLIFFSIVTFVAAILDFEALKEGKLSVIDVVLEIELPITIALGFFFFKESLSFLQFLIISFVFIGIVLIATKSFSHWKTRLERGVLIAFFAAIGMGIVNFLAAHSSRSISINLSVFSVWTITALFSLFFIWKGNEMKKFVDNSIKYKWLILAMGIFDTFAWFFYMRAVLKNETPRTKVRGIYARIQKC